MSVRLPEIEMTRRELQRKLDNKKSQSERNRLGQFATPPALAQDILDYAKTLTPKRGRVSFLDPALGTGAFYSAFLRSYPANRRGDAMGFEIDLDFARGAKKLWGRSGLTVKASDFTTQSGQPKFGLVICNPPYVRHHHIGEAKARLQTETAKACGFPISGLAGLYTYFIGLSHSWLAKRAISGWLVPSEFMDVNYGRELKNYLLHRVTLLRIHRFDPNEAQFEDAIVSSAVVWFRNEARPQGHAVEFTYGGTLLNPLVRRVVAESNLEQETKWTRFPNQQTRARTNETKLSDYFKISRGLATGSNAYFILPERVLRERNLPLECFKPILPSSRYIPDDEITADDQGVPYLDRRLFILDTMLSEDEIASRYPSLIKYLEEGKRHDLHKGYLCSHRKPWYAQEKRAPAPIVCTYLGRSNKKSGRPFRFILNNSQATVANVYLAMYPTAGLARAISSQPTIIREIWRALNQISSDTLLAEGRVYGGGLHKLEPRELSNVPVPEIARLVPVPDFQRDLFMATAAE